MKIRLLIGALALTVSSGAFAAEAMEQKECCCCKKDEHGKMACCKDKAKETEKTGHDGHGMEGMDHK